MVDYGSLPPQDLHEYTEHELAVIPISISRRRAALLFQHKQAEDSVLEIPGVVPQHPVPYPSIDLVRGAILQRTIIRFPDPEGFPYGPEDGPCLSMFSPLVNRHSHLVHPNSTRQRHGRRKITVGAAGRSCRFSAASPTSERWGLIQIRHHTPETPTQVLPTILLDQLTLAGLYSTVTWSLKCAGTASTSCQTAWQSWQKTVCVIR